MRSFSKPVYYFFARFSYSQMLWPATLLPAYFGFSPTLFRIVSLPCSREAGER